MKLNRFALITASFPRRRESMLALVDSRLRGNDGCHLYCLFNP
jgi:hypothetical protein